MGSSATTAAETATPEDAAETADHTTGDMWCCTRCENFDLERNLVLNDLHVPVQFVDLLAIYSQQ